MERKIDEEPAGGHEDVVAEHNEIKNLLAELDSDDLETVRGAIMRMNPLLRHHFAREERAGGLFDHVLDTAPRYSDTVAHLKAEHIAMLGLLDELTSEVEGATDADVLRGHAHKLVEQLRQHEATETSLLVDALYTDLGEGD